MIHNIYRGRTASLASMNRTPMIYTYIWDVHHFPGKIHFSCLGVKKGHTFYFFQKNKLPLESKTKTLQALTTNTQFYRFFHFDKAGMHCTDVRGFVFFTPNDYRFQKNKLSVFMP